MKKLSEKRLTPQQLNKQEEIIKDLKKQKKSLVKKYGKDAEKVMYGRATKLAKSSANETLTETLNRLISKVLVENQPTIAPPKPKVDPKAPPKRRTLEPPKEAPTTKPKAKLTKESEDALVKKIVSRFKSLKK